MSRRTGCLSKGCGFAGWGSSLRGVVVSCITAVLCQGCQNRLVLTKQARLIFIPRQKFSDGPSVVSPVAVLGSQSSNRTFGNGFSQVSWLCPRSQIPVVGQLLCHSHCMRLSHVQCFLWQTALPAPSTGGKARKESVFMLPKSHF